MISQRELRHLQPESLAPSIPAMLLDRGGMALECTNSRKQLQLRNRAMAGLSIAVQLDALRADGADQARRRSHPRYLSGNRLLSSKFRHFELYPAKPRSRGIPWVISQATSTAE